MRLIFGFAILATSLNFGVSRNHYWQYLDKREKSLHKTYNLFSDDLFLNEELWFTQYLDHFNPTDDRVWKQRYFMNNDYHVPNGPVFLYIGGESSTDGPHGGLIADEAEHFGAMQFTLEHRFYGKSQPFPDLSDENLKYLNAEQALLDAAYFIEGMNKVHDLPKDTKWIVFGCSYPGSLAAWMRAKYPHLVHGAVSISAPLVAKVHFPEYMMAVEEGLKTHSQACADVVSNATEKVSNLLRNSSGRKKLTKLFRLCGSLDNEDVAEIDISSFLEDVAQIFAAVVQYDTIQTDCEFLVDEKGGAPINRLAAMSNLALKDSGQKCLNFKYSNKIENYKNVTKCKLADYRERQWLYQVCTEFGWLQTLVGTAHLFGDRFPADYYLRICADTFGPQMANLTHLGVERTNLIFGGLDLANVVSNVVFVHGSIDPWRKVGITNSSNPKAPAFVVNGSSHCADLGFFQYDENDDSEVMKTRRQVRRLLGQWLEV